MGQFKDELKGDHIVEFRSGGPKNYGYKTARGKIETKVRGFTLNKEGSQQLNFDVMKHNILAELFEPLDLGKPPTIPVTERYKILRVNKQYLIFTRPSKKTYRLVANKRVFPLEEEPKEPFTSYPYGYDAWANNVN